MKIRNLVEIWYFPKSWIFTFFFSHRNYEKRVQNDQIQFSVKTHSGPSCWVCGCKQMDLTAGKSAIWSKIGTRGPFQNPGFSGFSVFFCTKDTKFGQKRTNLVFGQNWLLAQLPGFPVDLTVILTWKSVIWSKFSTFQNAGFSFFSATKESYEKLDKYDEIWFLTHLGPNRHVSGQPEGPDVTPTWNFSIFKNLGW